MQVDGAECRIEHLKQRKELRTAYLLWCSAGLFGVHHFYLGRLTHGVLAASTMNFLALGWLFDMLAIPVYVRGVNSHCAPAARHDRSCGRICWRMPVASTLWAIVFMFGFACIPRWIHGSGLVDIDATLALTKSNPYQLLDLKSDTDQRTAAAAFKRETLSLQKDCPALAGSRKKSALTDKECKARQNELKKAYNYVTKKWTGDGKASGKRKPKSSGKSQSRDEWDEYMDSKTLEWKTLGNIAQGKVMPWWKDFEAWINKPRKSSEEAPNSDL